MDGAMRLLKLGFWEQILTCDTKTNRSIPRSESIIDINYPKFNYFIMAAFQVQTLEYSPFFAPFM